MLLSRHAVFFLVTLSAFCFSEPQRGSPYEDQDSVLGNYLFRYEAKTHLRALRFLGMNSPMDYKSIEETAKNGLVMQLQSIGCNIIVGEVCGFGAYRNSSGWNHSACFRCVDQPDDEMVSREYPLVVYLSPEGKFVPPSIYFRRRVWVGVLENTEDLRDSTSYEVISLLNLAELRDSKSLMLNEAQALDIGTTQIQNILKANPRLSRLKILSEAKPTASRKKLGNREVWEISFSAEVDKDPSEAELSISIFVFSNEIFSSLIVQKCNSMFSK